MSVLEELFNGNINPTEKYIKKGSEYQKLHQELTDYIDELLPLLNGDEQAICEKIADNASKLSYITEKERFIEGFCLGAKLVLEILQYKSSNYI